MANHKSSLKRHRQDIKKRARNMAKKNALRTLLKKLDSAISGKNRKEADELLKKSVRALDRAVSKNIIPRKRASRKIARISKAVHQIA